MSKRKKPKVQPGDEKDDWKPEPPDSDIVAAHRHCTSNRAEIARSSLCGCFYCERTFPPAEVDSFLRMEDTAMCPYCDIDSVIGSASGFDLSKDFLRRMHDFWFG